jgi:transcriptional regulator with XRE-family HTH domain
MTYAGKNLRYLRRLRGWTQEEFANKLKIKRSLVGAYEEERAEPRIEVLEQLGQIFKLSLDELLLKDIADTKNNFLSKRRASKLATNSANIQFVPVKAAAGYLAGYADPEFVDELNTFTLPMLATGNYRAFEIVGDSMLPTPSGSVIVGEKIEKLEQVKPSHTYVVISKQEGIVYKRIVKNGRTKSKLTLVSDNPTYQPYQVEAEDLLEIWQAQMVICKASHQHKWDVNQLAGLVANLQDQVTTLKKKLN